RKTPMLVAYLLLALSMWLFVNGGIPQIIVSLVLAGAGQVMMYAALSSLIADLTPRGERGKVNASLNFAGYVMMALGNLVGGLLYEHASPRMPFYLAISMAAPVALVTALLVKEPEKREE
ncbi:MAG: MFS transporter, partial [Desulfurococcaceae archaeon]